jgi:hypothetical protein
MAAFDPGDIADGGTNEYIAIYHADGSFSQVVHVTDTGTITGASSSGPQTLVTGVTFRPPTDELFSVSTPSMALANVAHDIDWIPNDAGLIVARVPAAGQIQLIQYDFDDTIIGGPWNVAVPPGYGRQHVKISVACDSDTVFYTTQQKVVKRWSLASGQLSDYWTLPSSSPYIFGGLRALSNASGVGDNRDIVVAMTQTGRGPREAVCLDSDGISLWSDEINPTGNYRILNWLLSEATVDGFGDLVGSLPVQTDSGGLVGRTLALACNYNPCRVARRFIGFTTVIS